MRFLFTVLFSVLSLGAFLKLFYPGFFWPPWSQGYLNWLNSLAMLILPWLTMPVRGLLDLFNKIPLVDQIFSDFSVIFPVTPLSLMIKATCWSLLKLPLTEPLSAFISSIDAHHWAKLLPGGLDWIILLALGFWRMVERLLNELISRLRQNELNYGYRMAGSKYTKIKDSALKASEEFAQSIYAAQSTLPVNPALSLKLKPYLTTVPTLKTPWPSPTPGIQSIFRSGLWPEKNPSGSLPALSPHRQQLKWQNFMGKSDKLALSQTAKPEPRSAFYEKLQTCLKRTQTESCALGLLIVEIVPFTYLLDRYGVSFAQRVSNTVAHMIMLAASPLQGTVYQLGASKFSILLINQPAITTTQLAELIRQNVRQMSFPEYPEVKIAVSLGVVTHRLGPETQENVTVDTLIAEAELQLAKATQSGQNRVFGSIVL